VKYSTNLPLQIRGKFINGFSHASKSGFQVGRGQTGTSGNLPKHLPASVVQQLEAMSRNVFDHAFLNAMKPSLAIPVSIMVIGAIAAFFMEGNRESMKEAQEPETGSIAAAGS
jgi:hypothetical protein